MITLTTEIKSRHFKESEKEWLLRALKEPYNKKIEEIFKSFKEFLENNVMGLILDKDLLELGRKPYCKKSTNYFNISPTEFGLPDVYTKPGYENCSINLKYEHYSDKYRIAIADGKYTSNITSDILKKCPDDIIEQIKYFLTERAKARFEYVYYGVGTFIKPNPRYRYYNYETYNIFPDITTWGSLYNKDPKMFEILYNSQVGDTQDKKYKKEPDKDG